jgi:hypothetical protein
LRVAAGCVARRVVAGSGRRLSESGVGVRTCVRLDGGRRVLEPSELQLEVVRRAC